MMAYEDMIIHYIEMGSTGNPELLRERTAIIIHYIEMGSTGNFGDAILKDYEIIHYIEMGSTGNVTTIMFFLLLLYIT